MRRIQIKKESSSKVLDERISVYLDENEAISFTKLLKRTWPNIHVDERKIA